MTLVEALRFVCLGLACLALAAGYALGGLWTWGLAALLPLLLWLIGLGRPWSLPAAAGLVAFATLAAAGLLAGLAPAWMLLALVAALCAWDLDHLARRLAATDLVPHRRDLEKHHLLRLLAVAGLGLLLALVALEVELQLTFFPALLLGLLALWGLSRLVRHLRRENR